MVAQLSSHIRSMSKLTPSSQVSQASIAQSDFEIWRESGNEEAFTRLFHDHYAMVVATIRRVYYDLSVEDDIVQDVFLTLAKKAQGIQDTRKLGPWLHKTAYQFSLQYRRNVHRRKKYIITDQEIVNRDNREQENETKPPWLEHLDAVLLELDEESRLIVVLRYFQGKNYVEVGKECSLSADAVRMRCKKIIKELQGKFNRIGTPVLGMSLLNVLEGMAVESSRQKVSTVTQMLIKQKLIQQIIGLQNASFFGSLAAIWLMPMLGFVMVSLLLFYDTSGDEKKRGLALDKVLNAEISVRFVREATLVDALRCITHKLNDRSLRFVIPYSYEDDDTEIGRIEESGEYGLLSWHPEDGFCSVSKALSVVSNHFGLRWRIHNGKILIDKQQEEKRTDYLLNKLKNNDSKDLIMPFSFNMDPWYGSIFTRQDFQNYDFFRYVVLNSLIQSDLGNECLLFLQFAIPDVMNEYANAPIRAYDDYYNDNYFIKSHIDGFISSFALEEDIIKECWRIIREGADKDRVLFALTILSNVDKQQLSTVYFSTLANGLERMLKDGKKNGRRSGVNIFDRPEPESDALIWGCFLQAMYCYRDESTLDWLDKKRDEIFVLISAVAEGGSEDLAQRIEQAYYDLLAVCYCDKADEVQLQEMLKNKSDLAVNSAAVNLLRGEYSTYDDLLGVFNNRKITSMLSSVMQEEERHLLTGFALDYVSYVLAGQSDMLDNYRNNLFMNVMIEAIFENGDFNSFWSALTLDLRNSNAWFLEDVHIKISEERSLYLLESVTEKADDIIYLNDDGFTAEYDRENILRILSRQGYQKVWSRMQEIIEEGVDFRNEAYLLALAESSTEFDMKDLLDRLLLSSNDRGLVRRDIFGRYDKVFAKFMNDPDIVSKVYGYMLKNVKSPMHEETVDLDFLEMLGENVFNLCRYNNLQIPDWILLDEFEGPAWLKFTLLSNVHTAKNYLNDSDYRIRARAVDIIRQSGPSDSTHKIAKQALRDQHALIRVLALMALDERSVDYVSCIQQLLIEEENSDVIITALALLYSKGILSEVDINAAVGGIEKFLDHKNKGIVTLARAILDPDDNYSAEVLIQIGVPYSDDQRLMNINEWGVLKEYREPGYATIERTTLLDGEFHENVVIRIEPKASKSVIIFREGPLGWKFE